MVNGREPQPEQFRPAWGLPEHFGIGGTPARGAGGASPMGRPHAVGAGAGTSRESAGESTGRHARVGNSSDAAGPASRHGRDEPAADYGDYRAWSESGVPASGRHAGVGGSDGAGVAAAAGAGALGAGAAGAAAGSGRHSTGPQSADHAGGAPSVAGPYGAAPGANQGLYRGTNQGPTQGTNQGAPQGANQFGPPTGDPTGAQAGLYGDPGQRAESLEYGDPDAAPTRAPRTGRFGRAKDRLPSWLDRRRAAYIGVGVFMFLAVIYGVDIATSIGKVPRGTEIAGVSVGSMSYDDAESKLVDKLGPRLTDPVALRAGAVSTELDPEKVGLSVDWKGTLDRAGEQPLNPFTRFISLFKSNEVGIESHIADQRLTTYLESLGRQANLEPREGAVWFDKENVKSVMPRDGQSLRVEDSRQAVLEHWLDEGGVDLAVDFTPTQTKADQVQEVVQKIAEPAVRAPLDIVGSHLLDDGAEPEKKDVELTGAPKAPAQGGDGENAQGAADRPETTKVNMVPADDPAAVNVQFPLDRVGEYLSFEQHGDKIEPIYNADAAKGILTPLLDTTQAEGRDAGFAFSGDTVTVEPAVMGRTIQWGPLLGKVQAGLQDRGPRTVPVSYESQPPNLTTDEANKAGIREKVGESTIAVPPGSAAQRMLADINGHLVKSGTTADLSSLTSPISGSEGADAVATAFFNAAYEAGMSGLQRTPRGVDDPIFPVARDASGASTVAFHNQQDTGIVVEAFTSGNSVTVRLWGTAQYEVESQEQPRTNVVRAGSKTETTEGCRPSSGKDGYTAQVTRIVKQGTREVSRDEFKSTYPPVDAVTCAAPPRENNGGDRSGPTGTTDPSPSPAPVPGPAPAVPDLPKEIQDLLNGGR